MHWQWGVADPALRSDRRDMPHIPAHGAASRAAQRRGGRRAGSAWRPPRWRSRGCSRCWGHRAHFLTGVECDLYLLEGDSGEVAQAARKAASYDPEVEVLLDTPFQSIVPLHYDFAERIRGQLAAADDPTEGPGSRVVTAAAQDRVWLITGCSSGLGRAIARAALGRGGPGGWSPPGMWRGSRRSAQSIRRAPCPSPSTSRRVSRSRRRWRPPCGTSPASTCW